MQVNSFSSPVGPSSVGFSNPGSVAPPPVQDHCHEAQSAPALNPQQFSQINQGYNELNVGWQGIGTSGGGRPTVALIDDFGSSHGGEMQQTLNQAGANTLDFNINVPGQSRDGMIAASLQNVLQRLASGEKIDAISLSQQDFQAGPEAGQVQQLVAQIQQQYGVPVVVAAGNGGAGEQNQLAGTAALVASNATPGTDQLASTSGIGNILQQAPTTSFATAMVAARAAFMRNRGFSIGSIIKGLQQQAAQQGGALF